MKHIVGFSGGIDSQACARWVLNRFPADDVILINSEAGGNESRVTVEFVRQYSETVHPVIKLQPLVSDMWKKPGHAEYRGLDGTAPLTFDLMAGIKGRFPSPAAQFCTGKLKIAPLYRWIRDTLKDEEFIRYSGVRRDESQARRDQAIYGWDGALDCETVCPLADWTKQMCFDFVRAHGEAVNPLYSLGFTRVGCAPCINSSKEDIRQWIQREPAMLDKVRAWEEQWQRTFFYPMVPGLPLRDSPATGVPERFNWIDEVAEWAMTDYGGRQFNILNTLAPPSCESRYGLCE